MRKETETQTTDTQAPDPGERADVIALRKTCDADGTGLSHYVLMDRAPEPRT